MPSIAVEIVYAEATHSIVKPLTLQPGALLADALGAAASCAAFSGLDLFSAPVGIFGKLARKDQPLHDGDRIEIYRPLAADPKIARRTRAAKTLNKLDRS
jgi:putative ubiquitin-RnfH superfamily antitoxin RatB of RatAB toxin-antitoxin module